MKRTATVLTIDDDRFVRRAFANILSHRGYRVLEAEDGASGLNTILRDHPDVVLLDLRMPGMDGLDVLSIITERESELPVIVVSGADAVDDAIQALKRGAWDYLTKPIDDIALLETAVGRAMERARLMRENHEYQRRIEEALEQLRRDQEAGRAIQNQLLPPQEQMLDGYQLSRRLFPSAILSGDFVDYFRIDRDRIGFYIADVAGHGSASAFVTVMLKTLMRQYHGGLINEGDDTICDPARTLERLNQDIRHHHVDKHLTMFYGVVDVRADQLAFANAGHYPYPLVRVAGEVVSIERPGRPVGLFPQATYQRHDLPVGNDFLMLLVSDGLLEHLPAAEDGTVHQRDELLSEPLRRGVEDMSDLVARYGLKDGHTGSDDIAILMVKGPRRG